MTQLTEKDAAQLVAAMTALGDELRATRQYFLAETATSGQRLVTQVDHIAAAVDHIRGVVDRLDGLVKDLTEKVKNVKLPKWLGTLAAGE